MQETHTLIRTVTAGGATLNERHEAFAEIVARFQDMAFGCAYALLADAYLAQDAAQEAFIIARSVWFLETHRECGQDDPAMTPLAA